MRPIKLASYVLRHVIAKCCTIAIVSLGVSGLTYGQESRAGRPLPDQSELSALIKAAKADGELVFYCAAKDGVTGRTAKGFEAKYGIKTSFIIFSSGALFQRYATEAESGTFAADLFIAAGTAEPYAIAGAKKGWIEPISLAGIPIVISGEFPKKFLLGHTSVVQVAPWIMAYNSEKLKSADAPKEFIDLLNPKYKGQILFTDPRSSDSYYDFWGLLLDRYGEPFFGKLRELNLRISPGAVPATNSLGAGEGAIQIPGTGQQYQDLIAKGAPISMVVPELAIGVEMKLVLTHRAKGRHPNAARLFANYVMSAEGNKLFSSDPTVYSIYDLSGLPKQYVSPNPGAVPPERKAQLNRLLGL